MRITSPPMLLGRKLLKNVATRYDDSRRRWPTSIPCGISNTFHRQVATSICSR
jgi:hypothetical protein